MGDSSSLHTGRDSHGKAVVTRDLGRRLSLPMDYVSITGYLITVIVIKFHSCKSISTAHTDESSQGWKRGAG